MAGCHRATDAYPNVKFRLRALRADRRYTVRSVCHAAGYEIRYDSWVGRAVSAVGTGIRLLVRSFLVCAAIVRHRDLALSYVPYPAVPVLWILSFVPRALRPRRIVADAFISLYDTIVFDRGLVGRGSPLAGALRRIEARALGQADLVIVDTVQNAVHYSTILDLPRARFLPLPLSTGFERIRPSVYDPGRTARLRIVYVGTMVPLHGVDVLCDALGQLDRALPIDVELYGDGQCAQRVAALVESLGGGGPEGGLSVRWQRGWCPPRDLIRILGDADLCIGILGTSAKAMRVWPYKNYLYMACGRALVTARTPASRALLGGRADLSPFLEVDPGDATGLAALFERLVLDKPSLLRVARDARSLFDEALSATAIADRLDAALRGTA